MKTDDKQLIPRTTQGWPKVRCVALDTNGKQCRKLAVWRDSYHGDNSWSEPVPSWVLIYVCEEHGQ